MKLVNFKIADDHCGVQTDDGRYFDLHNNFNFVSFNYLFSKRYFEISWNRSQGDWIWETDPKQLRIEFTNVTILRIKELDQNEDVLMKYQSDDLTLSIIGFTSKDDYEFHGYLADVNSKNENYPMAIQTQNGQGFIIYSESAVLKITE